MIGIFIGVKSACAFFFIVFCFIILGFLYIFSVQAFLEVIELLILFATFIITSGALQAIDM